MTQTTPNSRAAAPRIPTYLGTDKELFSSLSKLVQIESQIEPTVLGGELKYTAAEAAELTGLKVEQLAEFARWLGRPPSRIDDVRFADSDIEAIIYARDLARREHLDADTMGSTIRSITFALNRLALRETEAIIQNIAQTQNISDSEARLIAAETALPHSENLAPLVSHIWRRQYAAVVKRLTTNVITQRGVFGDDRDYPLLRAVGFADLVDFTARTKDAKATEFAELIRDFTDMSWDIIHDNGGRVVNFIGDAVFFLADNVPTGAEVGLALAAHGNIGLCGKVRVGMVWTRVLLSHGDVFGPGVNLASRIAAAADPGEMLIGPAATAQLSRNPRYQVTPRQPFEARGIGTIEVSRLRHAQPSSDADRPSYANAMFPPPADPNLPPVENYQITDA